MNPIERRALALAMRDQIELRISTLIADNAAKLETIERNVAAIEAALSELDQATESLIATGLQTVEKHVSRRTSELADRSIAALERAASVRDGERGPAGERGPEGPAGSLAAVRAHQPGEIYKAGDFVALPPGHPSGWAIARALEDTYELPGDDEAPWLPYVCHGRDGAAGLSWRGAHVTGASYAVGDVVIADGGSAWIRTADGTSAGIPGDGWDVIVKRGAKGSRGETGRPGRNGSDGVGIADLAIDGADLVITLTDRTTRRVPVPVIVLRGAP